MDSDTQQLVRYVGNEQGISAIEQVLFLIGDSFHIRIQWENDTALLTGACALAGGLIGGIAGGRFGATIGAGLGSFAGLTTSQFITLQELWTRAKETLTELFFIVLNFLRRFDAVDYMQAIELVSSSYRSKQELAIAIALGRLGVQCFCSPCKEIRLSKPKLVEPLVEASRADALPYKDYKKH